MSVSMKARTIAKLKRRSEMKCSLGLAYQGRPVDPKPLVLYEKRMIKEAQLFAQLLGATSLNMMLVFRLGTAVYGTKCLQVPTILE